MFGQGPQRVPRTGEDRLLERLKSLEQRLAGIERRGQSSTWSSSGVAGHSSSHAIDGSDPLNPEDIGAVDQTDHDYLYSLVTAKPSSYAVTITGDGTSDAFTVTHGRSTRDCIVAIREEASPWALVQTGYGIEYTTINSVTIYWDTAPAVGVEYRVIVLAR